MTTAVLRIYLAGREQPVTIPQASIGLARASVAYAAMTWLRFPRECRPASCWVVARDSVEPVVTAEGVDESRTSDVIAVIDPREVQAVTVWEVQPVGAPS